MPDENGAPNHLNERAQHLLRTLVERYIRDGSPVGSRALSKDCGLELSPATIRNVIADLEDLGLVMSPHTSAGRVPTAQGYRLFVDTLLHIEPLDGTQVREVQRQIIAENSRLDLMASVSSVLSDLTRLAGMVTLPKQDNPKLRQVEFLPLSDNQVLVIQVVDEREVQNRIIRTARKYSPAELEQAANFINQEYAGVSFSTVRTMLMRDLRKDRAHLDQMMRAAVEMAEKSFAPNELEGEDLFVSGQTNLMGYGDLGDMDKLRQLFDAFNKKHDILHLLDQSLHARGVQLFIGEESGYSVLGECSVVASPYEVDGRVVGVLGVIGPTRMAYDRIIPIVDVTAKIVGAALNQQH